MSGRLFQRLLASAVTVSVVEAAPGLKLKAADRCDVLSEDKVDCGKHSLEECEAASCCWRPVEPNPGNTPWCYRKAGSMKTCSLRGGEPAVPFSDFDLDDIRGLFVANLDVQGSGMVVAAPDNSTGPGGDYYFAWMRDGALSMNALLETSEFSEDVEAKMDHWLAWVERSSRQNDSSVDVLVEPKFEIPSGRPFEGGWCRPQTDGPGLRAITLMAYSKVKPAISGRAWALVQKQLDWVAANFSSDGCDLWEEVHSGDFFWNRYTMRKALTLGAEFAEKVGEDQQRAETYITAAKAITEAMESHIDARGFVVESTNRRLDTAVIEAFNVGDLSDGRFSPLSKEVVKTLEVLTNYFCNAYEVNQQGAAANVSGVLYGRYEGDTYNGGNPWILLTASVATLLYRQSGDIAQGHEVDPETSRVLASLLGEEVSAKSLLAAGDAVLKRVRTFLTNGMHMNEQIDRNSGTLTSAKDLTWNYANVLKAMKARNEAMCASGGPLVPVVLV